MNKNPHYGIKVNKRCSVFIAVTQEDRLDMFRGNKFLFYKYLLFNRKTTHYVYGSKEWWKENYINIFRFALW